MEIISNIAQSVENRNVKYLENLLKKRVIYQTTRLFNACVNYRFLLSENSL